MANTIVCGRLDNQLPPMRPVAKSELRRIFSDNPNAMKQPVYCPISTDGENIMHAGGVADATEFLEVFSREPRARLIVLTNKERLLLLEKLAMSSLTVRVLEIDYPIMTDVRHGQSLSANFDLLRKLLRKVKQLDIRGGSFALDQTSRHLHAIARKLRFKNTLDQYFFFAYKEGYQEVFKLMEERPDRAVIAFDFNSMYASCMGEQFCDPKSVKYVSFMNCPVSPCDLEEGIYRVSLRRAKPGFFLEKHPFLFKRLGRARRFKLAQDDSIEIVLFKDEIEYYGKFFYEVEVFEGFASSTTVPHPLLRKAHALYTKRYQSKSRGDAALENYCKQSLQLMHSATNKRLFKRKRFDCLNDALAFISAKFHIGFDGVGPADVANFFDKCEYFRVERHGHQVVLRYLDIRADCLLFSLSAKIVAAAKLKLMKTMERFLADGAVEICYANVDSLHVSIEKCDLDGFLDRHKDLISPELGMLKIQAIADRGYWFDVGRYWLKTNGEVVLFKNIGFNHKGAKSEFMTKRRKYVVRTADAFVQLSSYLINLSSCFSWSKRIRACGDLGSVDYARYEYAEVATPESANRTEANEILKSKKVKIDLFRRISGKEDGVLYYQC